MNKFFENIKKIEILMRNDLALHFLWMFFIQLILCYLFNTNLIVYLLPIIFGIGKEIYDLKIKKTYIDLYDIIATLTGGYFSIIMYKLIKN